MNNRLQTWLWYGGLLLLCFAWGFTSAGYTLPGGQPVSFWWHGLLLLLLFAIHVICHELGHFFTFRRRGLTVRAFYVGPCLFLLTASGYRFTLRFNPLTFIGGIVIPNLDAIVDEEDFNRHRSIFGDAVAAGPRATLITGVFLTLAGITLLLWTTATGRTIGLSLLLANLMITAVLLWSCLIQNDVAFGDFPAAKLLRQDDFFLANLLYQYTYLALDYEKAVANNHWLRQFLYQQLSTRYQSKAADIHTLGILETFLSAYLAGDRRPCPAVVADYVAFFANHPQHLRKKNNEPANLLYQRLILYFAAQSDERAWTLFAALSEPPAKDKVATYLYRQCACALGSADHRAFLANPANIRPASTATIFRHCNGYLETEHKINEKIFQKIGSLSSQSYRSML